MKKLLMLSLFATVLIAGTHTFAQEDKMKRASPPAKVSATTVFGNTITIDYSQPAIKGRTLGKDLAPYGKVWRTGANEATVFEISKDATINGKYKLAAGKYSLYTIPAEKNWTIIFNKKWDQWGTVYTEADDALRVPVTAGKSAEFNERMTFKVNKEGRVTLLWANTAVDFIVK